MSNGGAVYTHDADLEVKNQFLTITLTTNHAVYDALQIVYLRAVILTPAGTKKEIISSRLLEVVPFPSDLSPQTLSQITLKYSVDFFAHSETLRWHRRCLSP